MNTPFPVRKGGKFRVEKFFALIEQKRGRLELMAAPRAGSRSCWRGPPAAELELPELGFRKALSDFYRGTPLAPAPRA